MRYRVKGEDKDGNLLAIPFDSANDAAAQARHAAVGRSGEVERVFGQISEAQVGELTASLTAINEDGYRLTIELLKGEGE